MDRDVRIAMRRASADFRVFRGGTLSMKNVDRSDRLESRRMTMFRPGLLVLAILLLAPAVEARMAAQRASVQTLVRSFYPQWTFRRAIAESCGASARATVSGDFNGDGVLDHAARLARGDQGMIVAFVSRRRGFARIVLERGFRSEIMNQALELVPRGSRQLIIQADNDLPRRPMVLAHDAPAGGTCEASGYVYLIHGNAASRAFTSD